MQTFNSDPIPYSMALKNWAIGAAAVGMVLYILSGDTKLSREFANGSYANPAMGEIVLRDGQMAIDGKYLRYVVERDKAGPFLLPESYVGISARGILVDRGRDGLKLRIVGAARPETLELDDDDSGRVFLFTRRSGT